MILAFLFINRFNALLKLFYHKMISNNSVQVRTKECPASLIRGHFVTAPEVILYKNYPLLRP